VIAGEVRDIRCTPLSTFTTSPSIETSRRGRVSYFDPPVFLADSECFSPAAALAAFCSAFYDTICMSEFSPWIQMRLRKSTLPYLLKVTSVWG
jgi:hypothetical protein